MKDIIHHICQKSKGIKILRSFLVFLQDILYVFYFYILRHAVLAIGAVAFPQRLPV